MRHNPTNVIFSLQYLRNFGFFIIFFFIESLCYCIGIQQEWMLTIMLRDLYFFYIYTLNNRNACLHYSIPSHEMNQLQEDMFRILYQMVFLHDPWILLVKLRWLTFLNPVTEEPPSVYVVICGWVWLKT